MTQTANNHHADLSEQRAYLRALRMGALPEDTPRPHFDALEPTIQLIEEIARKSQGNVRAIEQTIATLLERIPALAELIEGQGDEHRPAAEETLLEEEGIPLLPSATKANEARADEASPTLDALIAFFQYWCTRSYQGYHEAVALWVLSTIAARRVSLPWRKGIWTPLYIMLVATSTTHAKTEAASYGRRILEDCGLDYLLCPDEISPQKLMHNMAGTSLPRNYAVMSEVDQEYQRLRLAFSGQRGWLYDEFGNKLQEIISAKGYNGLFYALLKQLYDCKRIYEYDTLARDNEQIVMPYLSILGTATPACLKPIAAKDSATWTDGTFARIAFIVPPKNEIKLQSAPLETCVVPEAIKAALCVWHERLGIPHCEIVETELVEAADETTPGKDKSRKYQDRPLYQIIKGSQAHEAYYQSLTILAQEHTLDERFRATYGRLPDMALRIAMLLASLENDNQMDLRHWGRGQAITERWRANFHELIAQISSDEERGGYGEMEDKVLDALSRMGKMATSRDIAQKNTVLRKLGSPEVRKILDELADAQVIHKEGHGRGACYGLKKETP